VPRLRRARHEGLNRGGRVTFSEALSWIALGTVLALLVDTLLERRRNRYR